MIRGTSVQISTLIVSTDFGSTTPLVGSMLSRTTPSYDILNVPKKQNKQNVTQHEVVDLHSSITHLELQST